MIGDGRTYSSWNHMKTRCLNKRDRDYKNYGARGITVCERWMKFENFLKDMGIRPVGCFLDRINNDGNYEPSNCRWATSVEQNNNSRKNHYCTHNGMRKTITAWGIYLGGARNLVTSRLRLGWKLSRALSTPVNKQMRRQRFNKLNY